MNNDTADFKKMYYEMARAAEKAIRILIETQQKCEEMYLAAGDNSAEVPEA